MIHPVILPSAFIFESSSASTVQGIFGFTTSTAAIGATFGSAIPQAWQISTVLLIIATLSSSVGYVINATSDRNKRWSIPLTSKTHT